jgi:hypothetical protein
MPEIPDLHTSQLMEDSQLNHGLTPEEGAIFRPQVLRQGVSLCTINTKQTAAAFPRTGRGKALT